MPEQELQQNIIELAVCSTVLKAFSPQSTYTNHWKHCSDTQEQEGRRGVQGAYLTPLDSFAVKGVNAVRQKMAAASKP